MADRDRLDRLLRVRTLQLGLARAHEVAARTQLDGAAALQARIAELADTVAPQRADGGFAASMAAAAYYRDRLHTSAIAAEDRRRHAAQGVEHARAASREARRDQSAIEKLIVRADARAVLKEMRAMEESAPGKGKRHIPC